MYTGHKTKVSKKSGAKDNIKNNKNIKIPTLRPSAI